MLILRQHSGVDFSVYKSGTIQRRITRRMALCRQKTPEKFAALLADHVGERDALVSDLLIRVTSFFRDADAFRTLKRKIFPALIDQHRHKGPVRIWTVGCSTGQEAYSLAMAYAEFADGIKRPPGLRIFATDLNEAMLEQARHGLYPKTIAQDVSPERLRRFFVEEKDGYRVNQPLREQVVFARQNILSDPPFSRMDLISCRNLLIYFQSEQQQRILPIFHSALTPGGFIFLGGTESVGSFTDLFKPADRKQKIFSRLNVLTRTSRLPLFPGQSAVAEVAPRTSRQKERQKKPEGLHGAARRVAELEQELAGTRDDLQSLQEKSAITSEALQASCEELQSVNEELQSLNEDLASTNTALVRVNDGMRNQNGELSWLNSELSNLQASMQTAILLIGPDLKLRRFTPLAEKIFNLQASDVGHSLMGIRHKLVGPDLLRLLAEVIATAHVRHCEVQDETGHWYSLRAQPSLTLEGKIDGAMLVLVEIDALKQNEQDVRAARDYAEAILSTLRDPSVILQADLRVKSASKAFYQTFQTTPKQTEGRLFFELGNGQWQIPRLRELLEQVLPGNTSFDEYEVVHDFPLIGRRVMRLNSRRLEMRNANQLILLSIEDVTERLVSRDAARATEVRYRRLFEAAKDGILMVDPVSRKIIDANSFMTQLLGYHRKDLLDKQLWEIGLLKDEPSSQVVFRELQEKGFIRYEDLAVETKTGLSRDVEFVSKLYTEGSQKVIQCNIRDITERKQAEQTLQQSEVRYLTLFNLGLVGVYSCDAAGVIQEYNEQAAVLWGRRPARGDVNERYSSSGKMLRPDGSPLAPDDCPMAALLTGRTTNIIDSEICIARPDGSQITCVVNIAPLKNASGEITGAINCFYDVTERKEMERELLASVEELKLAQREALRFKQTKTDFIAALSHELRTPLTPVLLTATALREDLRLPPDVREQLGMMERNIALEARMIDDLLDLTKVSHDRLRLRAQLCDVHELIELAVAIVAEEARAKGLSIERVLTARDNRLLVDPARFQQVMWNLLRNAVKFTPQGGRISVTTREEEFSPGETGLRIEVTDSGIGIDATRLEQIFQPFDQGGLRGDHRYGGVGLGLAIARSVIALHGGRISAQSDGADLGATFVVELPGATASTLDVPVSPAPVPGNPAATVTPLRLLLVEDHASTLEALSRLLQRDGHKVTAATNIAAALEAAAAQQFDLVVSDLGLPDGKGMDLMKKLNASYGLRGIALSGYGMAEDLALSCDAGFITHLVKPVSIAELRHTLAAFRPNREPTRRIDTP
ncbi:MAG: CheR family methyltransferase [Opitutaceae bacterium]